MRYFIYFILNTIIFINMAFPLGITHLNKPHTSYLSLVSQSSCSTYKGIEGSIQCNPALYPFLKVNMLQLQGTIKSEGSSVETGKDLIFEPVDKDFLETLFSKKNLISFNFDSNINFYTDYFLISYSPYYLIADAYVFNPAFPEISMFLNKQSTIRFSSGYDLSSFTPFTQDTLSVGISIFSRSRESFKGNLLLTDFAQEDKDIIKLKKDKEIASDIGAYFQSHPNLPIPYLSLQIKNLFSSYDSSDAKMNSATELEPFLLFETYSQLGIGQTFKTTVGEFNVGVEFPFEGFYRYFYQDYWSCNITYNLGLFMGTLAYSNFFKTAGLYFNSSMGSIGIIYAREEEIAGKSITSEMVQDSIYVEFDIKI